MRGLFVLLALNIAAYEGSLIDMPTVIPDLRNPHIASLMFADGLQIYYQHCVGTIINNYSILTSASCSQYRPHLIRARVGSQYPGSFGWLYHVSAVIAHPDSSSSGSVPSLQWQNDIGIIRVASAIEFSSNAYPATFAGQYDFAVGAELETYGFAVIPDFLYEPMRKQKSEAIASEECSKKFELSFVNDDMICSVAITETPQRRSDLLVQNYGSPLYHDGIVVGVASYLQEPNAPVVHTKVSSFIDWITANA